MLHVLHALTILPVAVGMALSLAHALEFPGKRRLDRDTYFAVQPIYYPDFTIGGAAFWRRLTAFVSLLVMHGLYWVLTHPVNRVWLRGQELHAAGDAFFAAGGRDAANPAPSGQDGTALRDRWEYSHVARAVFAMLSLTALVTAATL
jgi:hypothetical protein